MPFQLLVLLVYILQLQLIVLSQPVKEDFTVKQLSQLQPIFAHAVPLDLILLTEILLPHVLLVRLAINVRKPLHQLVLQQPLPKLHALQEPTVLHMLPLALLAQMAITVLLELLRALHVLQEHILLALETMLLLIVKPSQEQQLLDALFIRQIQVLLLAISPLMAISLVLLHQLQL